MEQVDFASFVAKAALAPSVHNIQPARWRLVDPGTILIAQDLAVALPAADPTGQDAVLSVGAAVEATVLVLSQRRLGVVVENLWTRNDRATVPGHRLAARIAVSDPGQIDPLAAMLPHRFTHRGAFLSGPPGTWDREDADFLTTRTDKTWIAALNDQASLRALRKSPIRAELRQWLRLSPRHPRWALDGMNRLALRQSPAMAMAAGLVLGPLWPLANALGLSGMLTAEAAKTRSAVVIGCFHRPLGEDPITTGRAYLRFCLQATGLGYAQWPMAALTDDPATHAAITERLALPHGRCLVQVIRFGRPEAAAPPRVRRAVVDLILAG